MVVIDPYKITQWQSPGVWIGYVYLLCRVELFIYAVGDSNCSFVPSDPVNFFVGVKPRSLYLSQNDSDYVSCVKQDMMSRLNCLRTSGFFQDIISGLNSTFSKCLLVTDVTKSHLKQILIGTFSHHKAYILWQHDSHKA